MTLRLVSGPRDDESADTLDRLYARGYTAPEKKPFLIDLARSSGPYLAIEGTDRALLDAASQIATFGLAFNHPALFGAMQHLESWIDWTASPEFTTACRSFAELLRRQLVAPNPAIGDPRESRDRPLPDASMHEAVFCHSGAQAIELAVAATLAARTDQRRCRILAFEGAFHGRTKIALETTHGEDKRLPFSWGEHAARFVPYPELPDAEIDLDYDRSAWNAVWTQRDDHAYVRSLPELIDRLGSDSVALNEIQSLQAVRQHLISGEILCVLIEPLQSEGGDRYSSGRFHQSLAWLAQTYDVPLIYDEIQCGAHLGRTFFWHRQFQLVDRDDRPWVPDLIVCAKKTQVGIVLTRLPVAYGTPPPAASLFRGYIQCSLMDQSRSQIEQLEREVATRLQALADRWPQLVTRPRGRGLAFAFDLPGSELAKQLVEMRFRFGLIFYPAGRQTVRFRLSLAFGAAELDLLFAQLEGMLSELSGESATRTAALARDHSIEVHDPQPSFDFNGRWLTDQLAMLSGESSADSDDALSAYVQAQLRRLQPQLQAAEVRILDPASYRAVREQILQLQVEVYEPARQTAGRDFDAVFQSQQPLGIAVLLQGRLIGMAIAGSAGSFRHVAGIAEDPRCDDPATVYMVDVTVVSEFRGGLGRLLKQALTMLAAQRGVQWVLGRNRDRLARGMWAINLSLGALQIRHLPDAYDDDALDRDCIVYQIATRWTTPPVCLANGLQAPFAVSDLSPDFIRRQLPVAVNKLTLSNFVDRSFVDNLADVIELFPPELRHAYTASSLSESIDKLVKVFHLSRQPRRRLVTITGHDCGDGTLLSRALANVGPSCFDVTRLPPPDQLPADAWLAELNRQLGSADVLAMFLEPFPSNALSPMSAELLRSIAESCRRAEVPLVYHESCSLFYRYDRAGFAAAVVPGCLPDGIVAGLGGQMAIGLLNDEYFDPAPLKVISTWDGDSFSLARFAEVARKIECDRDNYFRLIERFEQRLQHEAAVAGATSCQLHNSVGWIEGLRRCELADSLLHGGADGRYRVLPSFGELRRWLREFELER